MAERRYRVGYVEATVVCRLWISVGLASVVIGETNARIPFSLTE